MSLKAVLFDMDGVIVDTEPLHTKAYYRVFEHLGLNITDEYFATCTGESTKNVFARLIQNFDLSHEISDLVNLKRQYFKQLFDEDRSFDLLPGVEDLFKAYRENNIELVLASSASMNTIKWVFDKFDLTQYFKAKISGDELKASKPHPEIFNIAAQLADCKKHECMVIEDSTNGILAAHRAEIFCAAYRSKNTHQQDYSLANMVVDSFDELHPLKMEKYFQ